MLQCRKEARVTHFTDCAQMGGKQPPQFHKLLNSRLVLFMWVPDTTVVESHNQLRYLGVFLLIFPGGGGHTERMEPGPRVRSAVNCCASNPRFHAP